MFHLKHIVFSKIRFKHTWIRPEGYDTGIKIYNCVARENVPLILRNKNFTTWYTCGPTVYDSAHIGHASCYVKLDIIQRILRDYFKINLITAMNITDVDDKIIKKSKETKAHIQTITQMYEKEFWEDMDSLGIIKPDLIVRVTENMTTIKNFINKLVKSRDAYQAQDGSIMFKIKDDENYGKLQNINQDTKVDFTIWKTSKPNEPYWSIECSQGRPGWHTECSALASATFGSCIDIHAGGIDLRFPHHENEEAQSCAYFSKPQWVNYWLHTGHLLQNSTKMSKSLNNTISIRKMLEMCNADSFRMMCLMSNYRYNVEFTTEYVHTADKYLENCKNFLVNCGACIANKLTSSVKAETLILALDESVIKVQNALCDDFDTATCIKVMNSFIMLVNKMLHSSTINVNSDLDAILSLSGALNFVVNTLGIFGIDLNKKLSINKEQDNTTQLVNMLIEYRQNVRQLAIDNKDKALLQLCDDVRNNLKTLGVTLRDQGKVSVWSK